MTLLSGRASHTSVTASHTALATSNSVAEKHSGLYWKIQLVCGYFSAYCLTNFAPLTAKAFPPSTSIFNTFLRKVGALEL